MTGPILIQGAMEVETDWLAAQLEGAELCRQGTYLFWRGRCRGRDLVVSRTGIGMVHAAAATALGILDFRPRLVLSQGLAGAHVPQLCVGDLVVGESCADLHSLETPQRGLGEGSDPFHWTLTDHGDRPGVSIYPGDPVWAARFLEAPYSGGEKMLGRLGSGDVFNREHDRIQWLRDRAGELCEDMESFAVYQTCAQLETPCLGVRIISNNELTGAPYRREVGLQLQRFVLSALMEETEPV